jgi:hypothetical protein
MEIVDPAMLCVKLLAPTGVIALLQGSAGSKGSHLETYQTLQRPLPIAIGRGSEGGRFLGFWGSQRLSFG